MSCVPEYHVCLAVQICRGQTGSPKLTVCHLDLNGIAGVGAFWAQGEMVKLLFPSVRHLCIDSSSVYLRVISSSKLLKIEIDLISEEIYGGKSFWLRYCSHICPTFELEACSPWDGVALRWSRNDVQKNIICFQGQGAGHSQEKSRQPVRIEVVFIHF